MSALSKSESLVRRGFFVPRGHAFIANNPVCHNSCPSALAIQNKGSCQAPKTTSLRHGVRLNSKKRAGKSLSRKLTTAPRASWVTEAIWASLSVAEMMSLQCGEHRSTRIESYLYTIIISYYSFQLIIIAIIIQE